MNYLRISKPVGSWENKFCFKCGQLLNEEAWKSFMSLYMRKEFDSRTGKPVIVSNVITKGKKIPDNINQEDLQEEYEEVMKKIRDENIL